MFIKPMFAQPLTPKFDLTLGNFYGEEKIDGFRIIVEISHGSTNLFAPDKLVTPWSRYGLVHPLPTHITEDLAKFPNCILDCEAYVPGKRSYGSLTIENQPDLILCVFDLLQIGDMDVTPNSQFDRRNGLVELAHHGLMTNSVKLIESIPVNSWDEIYKLRDDVYARDGEGLIIKDYTLPYTPGKRHKHWIKIKKLESATLTVIGFIPSRGEINDRGLYAMTVIEDEEGNVTVVKTRNDALCRELERVAPKEELQWRDIRVLGKPLRMIVNHPYIGRKLKIEYQERTFPDNSYRHPRWDRWENE